MTVLEEVTREIERFRQKMGLTPVRLELGSALMREMRNTAVAPVSGAGAHLPMVSVFNGTPVYGRLDLGPREWALVFTS